MRRPLTAQYAGWLVGVALASGLLAGGCAAPAAPPGQASGPSAAPTAGVTTPTGGLPTSSTTPVPTAAATIPEAAKAPTIAGAEAFARYFWAQFNLSLVDANPGLLPPLFLPTCTTCGAFAATAKDYQSRSLHFQGEPLSVLTVATSTSAPQSATVAVIAEQRGGATVDAAGKVVEQAPRQPSNWVMYLDFSEGWLVRDLKVAK